MQIHEKVSKEINSTHLAIDNRRKLSSSILSYGDHVISKKAEDTALLGNQLLLLKIYLSVTLSLFPRYFMI